MGTIKKIKLIVTDFIRKILLDLSLDTIMLGPLRASVAETISIAKFWGGKGKNYVPSLAVFGASAAVLVYFLQIGELSLILFHIIMANTNMKYQDKSDWRTYCIL